MRYGILIPTPSIRLAKNELLQNKGKYVFKALVLLVEIVTEPVQVLALATKMDIGRPPTHNLPQRFHRT